VAWTSERILEVLDAGAASFTFPALDNGYIYLAATRLSAYWADQAWALTIEVFGYSPREGIPSIYLTTFGNDLRNRKRREDFVNAAGHDAYLSTNAPAESVSFWPIEDGDWLEDCDDVASDAAVITVRTHRLTIPTREECLAHGVVLERERLQIFELCRYVAATDREAVLATDDEQRTNIRPDMQRILRLEDWHHPDIIGGERPSDTQTFRHVAEVLATGDAARYRPREPANTHWRNWPEGGSL
jgi:hypothetical protein